MRKTSDICELRQLHKHSVVLCQSCAKTEGGEIVTSVQDTKRGRIALHHQTVGRNWTLLSYVCLRTVDSLRNLTYADIDFAPLENSY